MLDLWSCGTRNASESPESAAEPGSNGSLGQDHIGAPEPLASKWSESTELAFLGSVGGIDASTSPVEGRVSSSGVPVGVGRGTGGLAVEMRRVLRRRQRNGSGFDPFPLHLSFVFIAFVPLPERYPFLLHPLFSPKKG
ncbi:hypothetical protein U1Q18_025451 [Sarracenia purpurea var. burkii]